MGEPVGTTRGMSPEVRCGVIPWWVKVALGVVAYGTLIFVSVGDLRWAWGWVLIGILTAGLAAHVAVLLPANPELLAEHGKGIRITREVAQQ